MDIGLSPGVVFPAKTGEVSVFSLSGFWSAKGADWLPSRVSDASNGVSGSSEVEPSSLLPQLAASKAVRASRQNARKLRGGVMFFSWAFSLAELVCGAVYV